MLVERWSWDSKESNSEASNRSPTPAMKSTLFLSCSRIIVLPVALLGHGTTGLRLTRSHTYSSEGLGQRSHQQPTPQLALVYALKTSETQYLGKYTRALTGSKQAVTTIIY